MALHDFIKTQFLYAKPYSVGNINDYRRILYSDNDNGTVFKAAQARLYGFTKNDSNSISIYNWLVKELYNYINNRVVETIVSFDEWHHRICSDFVSRCSDLGIRGARAGVVCYGLAQKFVNISLKYIYCFEDANLVDVYKKFDFCHVALDSYTYCPKTTSRTTAIYLRYHRAVGRILGTALNTPFYSECVQPAIAINHLNAWSKLNYHSVGATKGYIDIENEIRDYLTVNPIRYSNVMHLDIHGLATCPPSTILTPFETEFFLW